MLTYFFLIKLCIFHCLFFKLEALTCYSCQFSFNDLYDTINQGDRYCTNKTLLKMPNEEVIKPCSSVDNYCATIITIILNSFTSINRACTEYCSPICESVGYGQDQVTCTDCCKTNNCNKQTTVTYYRDVASRQHTSWIKPLNSEKDYNRKINATFPY